MNSIGIFGGTFNPIHFGHLRIAEELSESFAFQKLLFIPAGNPPLKHSQLAEACHRLEMVRIAIQNHPSFEVTDIEMKGKSRSFSVLTIEKLLQKYGLGTELFFIVGIDAFIDFHKWFQPEKILSLSNMIIVSRPLFNFSALASSAYLDNPPKEILEQLDAGETANYSLPLSSRKKVYFYRLTSIGISATQIRNLIMEGRSIKYLLPIEVESYIMTHHLYARKIRYQS